METKIKVKNDKGHDLSVIISRPKNDNKYPLVMMFVGFCGYKEWLPFEMLSKTLSDNNIASVRFDPSGFNESGGSIEDDYRFSNYINDAQAVFEYVSKLEYIDRNKIVVFGQSMGGIQASIFANKHKLLVKAISLVSSPVVMGSDDDLNGKYKKWKDEGKIERSTSKHGKFFVPFEFIEDARKYNALEYLKDLTIPLQVITCEADQNVHQEVTKKIFNEYKNAVEYKVIKNSDHFLNRDPKTIQIMVDYVARFIKDTLV